MLNSVVLQIIVAALVALALTWVAVSRLRAAAPRWGFIDVPNQRSSHHAPTPRGGGLAFAIAAPLVTITASLVGGIPLIQGWNSLVAGGAIVAAVGLADDRWGLPVRVRFGGYLGAAALLAFGGDQLHELQWQGGPSVSLGWLALPVTLLWVVGLTNAYNFMDGIDGIAAAQGVVATGTAALIALLQQDLGLALVAAVLAGGIFGFLLHNWPPAKIFMGDVGSAFLGYTLSGLAVLTGAETGSSVPFALWLILLAPFLFDTSLTLAVRVARGERWYEAHRQHLYQRLVRCGWPHLAVTRVYLSADLFLACMALGSSMLGLGGVALALAAALPLASIFGLVRSVEARHLKLRHPARKPMVRR